VIGRLSRTTPVPVGCDLCSLASHNRRLWSSNLCSLATLYYRRIISGATCHGSLTRESMSVGIGLDIRGRVATVSIVGHLVQVWCALKSILLNRGGAPPVAMECGITMINAPRSLG
jgi:hypothetical protein